MSQSKKECVLAALSGERPDRVPVFEYLIHDGVFDHFGVPRIQPGDTTAHLAACARCLDICHPLFGAPYVPGETTHPDGSKTVLERWNKWDLPPANGGDAVRAEWEKIERLERETFPDPGHESLLKEARAREAVTNGMVYISCCGSCALPYDNTESSIYLFMDEEELVERRMRAENRLFMDKLQATAYADVSPVAIIWNDIAYKTGLFYSLDLLERYLFPALRDVCALLHERGIKVIFHSDGDVSRALPGLVACGIDGLNPFELCENMCYDTFAETFGDRVTLVGGMDAVQMLAMGTPERVAAETRRLIDVVGKKGRLICASSSGQIDESMPVENVVAYLETISEYGRRR